MALTALQLAVLRLLAEHRKRSGESYVAGGVALNHVLQGPRISRDIDLFHDTVTALRESFGTDRTTLEAAGYNVQLIREVPTFVEALVVRGGASVLVQWVRDSAYRFFPLVEDDTLGLTLHPLDLATNKILALIGRLESRDWIDAISCHEVLQRLGYLIWAACGKDEGYGPGLMLEGASRQHYAQAELELLDFEGARPSAAILGRTWKVAVAEARQIVTELPAEQLGNCLLRQDGSPYSESPENLKRDLVSGQVVFHSGRIGGVWPVIVSS
jgi:hypothetical protein